MSQDFQEVTLNTEISQGLDLLQKRDLTAATRSDSQTSFPVSPKEGHVFCHSGQKQIYTYVNGKWESLWNYEHGAPYTINELNIKFQKLNDNLTNLSSIISDENKIFSFPQLSYTIYPNWLRDFGKCESKDDFGSFIGLKELAYLNKINGTLQISSNSIPPTAFEKDLETEVPREMSTGCVKRSFAPSWDKTKWLLCDGKTIGSPLSNADYRGTEYKNLFLHLGGNESMWQSGQVISLPNATSDSFVVSGDKFSTETKDFSFGFSMELRYQSGYAPFASFLVRKKGDVDFEIIGAGAGYAVNRWKHRGKSYALVSSGGGGECAVGTLHLDVSDKITVTVGKFGSGGRGSGSAGEETVIQLENTDIVVAKGGFSTVPDSPGRGGTGGYVSSEKAEATFYRGHSGQNYSDVGEHNPLTMAGGSSGDPKNICTDSPVGTHYAGNGLYVSYSDTRRVGSGEGGRLDTPLPPPYGGYARFSDSSGVFQYTENFEIIKCFFLIKT